MRSLDTLAVYGSPDATPSRVPEQIPATSLAHRRHSRGTVGILGGEIAALACAHYARRAGLDPVVLAPGPCGGDLVRRFDAGGKGFDCFHRPLHARDTALAGLLADLGLLHTVVWREASESEVLRSRVHRLTRGRGDWYGWVLPRRGARRIRDRVRGHLRGGYETLIRALEDSLLEEGGSLATGVRLQSVDADPFGVEVQWDGGRRRFDAVISTLPPADLAKRCRADVLSQLPRSEASPGREISIVLLVRRAPDLPYVTHLGPRSSFQRVVHAGRLVPDSERGDAHPIYLVRRTEADPRALAETDASLVDDALRVLAEIAPELSRSDVEGAEVFRSGDGDLTAIRDVVERPPPRRAGRSGLWLCVAARPYPRRLCADTSVMLARETVGDVAAQLRSSGRIGARANGVAQLRSGPSR